MKKYLVLFKCPLSVLDSWMQKPENERKPMEDDLKVKWDTWSNNNKSSITEMGGVGKTKMVKKDGTSDGRNEIMLYAIVQAENADAASKMFEGHPHLEIPESWIEVSELNSMM
jgi:hypothetical protein